MRTLIVVFVLVSLFSSSVPMVQAESIDNFPENLGAKCQRLSYSTHPELGFFVYYFSESTGSQMRISKEDTVYLVEGPDGKEKFSSRQAALEYVKTFCN